MDPTAAGERDEIGLLSAQSVSASVHSRARPTSKTSWQARITPQ